jgi:hypothetical protein
VMTNFLDLWDSSLVTHASAALAPPWKADARGMPRQFGFSSPEDF